MNLFRGLSGKFLIPYALTLVFGVWTYVTFQNIRELNEVKDSLQTIQIKVLDMRKQEKDFLARDYKNIDFITTGKSKYIESLLALMEELKSSTDGLRFKHKIDEVKLDSMQLLLVNYRDAFTSLASMIREKGFKDHGLEGKLRAAIHDVEDSDFEYDKYYMLMLRRHEKDFFLRKDMKYLEKFEVGTQAFRSHIQTIPGSQEKKDEILHKLSEYEAGFRKIVGIQNEIGLNEHMGLHGDLRNAIHQFSPYVDEIVVSNKKLMDAEKTKSSWALVLLFILIISIGAIVLFYHINKITRNINLIKSSALSLAKGAFPEKNHVNSRDELGQAHQALNVLTEGLKAKTRFSEDIGEGKLDAKLDLLGDDDILGHSLIHMSQNLSSMTQQINNVIELAGEKGELNARIKLNNKVGFWKSLSESINCMLEEFSKPVETFDKIVNGMAQGDLTHRYTKEANGDIKVLADNLNFALTRLSTLIVKISQHAEILDDSTTKMNRSSEDMNLNMNEIATSTEQMSRGAQNQVIKVDESSVLVESILVSIDDMANRSERIHDSARTGVENSNKGEEMVRNVEENMQRISQLTGKTSETVEILKSRSNEITGVLGLINEIATQTNLLALNASIEAAQAGDAGRGFAVVAEEIRKLADRSRSSVQEIEQLIRDVQNGTTATSKVIEEMNETVSSGEKTSLKARDVFVEMAASSQDTLRHSEEILEATKHRKQEIKEIAKITESIVVIAEQSAAGTEEMASSATELRTGMELFRTKSNQLSMVAGELNEEVNKFKLNIHYPDLLIENGSIDAEDSIPVRDQRDENTEELVGV